jgi:hypothetical protein
MVDKAPAGDGAGGASGDANDSSANNDKGAGAGKDAGASGGQPGGDAGAGGDQTLLAGAKPGAAGSDGKPAGDGKEPAPQGAPEKYEFKFPEGVTPDEKAVEEASKTFKELGLNQETAQKLIDLQAQFYQKAQEEAVSTYDQVRQGWKDATVKMLGGKLDESMGLAAKARDMFGSPELGKFLDESGLGNHPAMVAFFVNIGKAIREDPLADGKGEQGDKPLENRVYPNLK